MPRPKLLRNILSAPAVKGFTPNTALKTEEILLSVEEFEAIRLADFEGLDQTQAAEHMGVSRQTFGRVLRTARFVVAKALVKGLQLRVTGGCYRLKGHGHGGGGGRQRHRSLKEQGPTDATLFSGEKSMKDTTPAIKQQKKDTNPNIPSNECQDRDGKRWQGQGSSPGKGKRCGRGQGQGGGKGGGSYRQS